jgi:hypothetical protein
MLMKSVFFDKTVLKRFYNNSFDDFSEMLSEYIKNQKEIRLSLKAAFKTGILPLQKSIYFHSSIFCHVGFPTLTTSFLAFEARCKNTSDIRLLKECFDELLLQLDESVQVAKYEMKKLQQGVCV